MTNHYAGTLVSEAKLRYVLLRYVLQPCLIVTPPPPPSSYRRPPSPPKINIMTSKQHQTPILVLCLRESGEYI